MPLLNLPIGIRARTCLALLWQNLFAPVFFKNLLSAIWALLRRRPKDEIDDGVTYGGHGWLRRRSVDSFFSPRVCEATMLQEGVGNHCHQGVAMKTLA
jgi:hypothetical protein